MGEGETRRKKQTPNSLFSLSNSGGLRTEGREREVRRNLRGLERDSHTFHKFDTENEAIPGKSCPASSAREHLKFG